MHFRRLHYNTMACKEFCAEGGIVSIKVYDHLSQNNIADLFYHIWLPHIVHHISKIMHEKICSIGLVDFGKSVSIIAPSSHKL